MVNLDSFNYKSLKPEIWISYSNNDNLRNVNPAENISLFSGLNSPKPNLEYIASNSGDI